MARRLGALLACCLLAAAVFSAQAQDASECAALQSRLQSAEEKLARAEETERKCRQDAERLASKLESASKEAAEAEAKGKGCLAETERLKEAVQAASGEVQAKLEAAGKEAAAKLAAAAAAKEAVASELAAVQRELSEARKSAALFEELRARHEGEWLPHWLAVLVGAAVDAAGPALRAAQDLALKYSGETGQKAVELWATHAAPRVEKALALLKDAASQAAAFVEDKVPQVKAAGSKAYAAVVAAAQSEQVAGARAAAAGAATQAGETLQKVVAELERLLIAALGSFPNGRPLARKPYVTYMAYAVLGAPLLAVGLPAVGGAVSRRAAARGGEGGEARLGGAAQRSKAAAKRAKKRVA